MGTVHLHLGFRYTIFDEFDKTPASIGFYVVWEHICFLVSEQNVATVHLCLGFRYNIFDDFENPKIDCGFLENIMINHIKKQWVQ